MTSPSYTLVTSPFGTVTLLWQESCRGIRVRRVLLPDVGRCVGAEELSCPAATALATQLTRFLEGTDIQFPLEILALESCSTFQRQVLVAEHQIPRGRVSTYSLIADYLGISGGARAVGNALARNPFPLLIPCHRAIRSSGGLGGYQGGLEMKRKLLEMEGVTFSPSGRVITGAFFYASPKDGRLSC